MTSAGNRPLAALDLRSICAPSGDLRLSVILHNFERLLSTKPCRATLATSSFCADAVDIGSHHYKDQIFVASGDWKYWVGVPNNGVTAITQTVA
jgi:hypothetical protein